MRSVEPEVDPEIAELLREGRSALQQPPPRSQLYAELLVGGAFLLAASALAASGAAAVDWDLGLLVVLLLAYAGASRVTFELGQGETDASLLVLVPMLFLLPTPFVPLLVVAGWALGRAPDVLARREHPLHLVFALANAWHAVGPALVLVLATDPGGPRWEDGSVYGLALLAMLATDTVAGLLRERLGRGVRPELQLRLLLRVWVLDSSLAPVGLLAAFAATTGRYGFLLLFPLAAILLSLARERGTRLDNALALYETRTALLESELAASRGREEALAAVSHGLQTPLASVIGLARLLDERGNALSDDRRAVATTQLHHEALALRHRVRQVLDYPRVRAGRELALRPGACDLNEIAGRAIAASGVPEVAIEGSPPPLESDAVRVEQVLTALLDNAGRHGRPPVSLQFDTGADGAAVAVVTDAGDGVPAGDRSELFQDPRVERGRHEAVGTGIGLYVAAGIVAALGGTLELDEREQHGSRFVLTLPRTMPQPPPAA